MKKMFLFDNSENTPFILPEIILSGNKEITVDSLKEITEYTSDKVCMSLGKICLSLVGDSLEIKALGTERLTISGNIISISFSS